MEPYLRWVQTRAIKLRMSYPRQEVLPLKEISLYFRNDTEKLQIAFNNVQREKTSWRNKYQILSLENAKIQSLLKEKDALIGILERHVIEKDELLSSEYHSGTPYTWRRVVDPPTNEETRSKKQKRSHQQMIGSPSERIPQNP